MLLRPRLPVAITTAGAPGYTPGVTNHAAVSVLAGNLHKALFAASILISGNEPAWANLHLHIAAAPGRTASAAFPSALLAKAGSPSPAESNFREGNLPFYQFLFSRYALSSASSAQLIAHTYKRV